MWFAIRSFLRMKLKRSGDAQCWQFVGLAFDNPTYLAQERFNRAVYGDHPAALVTAPPESLKRTTAVDLAQFHSTYYRPNNPIIARAT